MLYIFFRFSIFFSTHIYPKFLDRWACANIADPYQTLQNVASEQGQHCLPLIEQFSDIFRKRFSMYIMYWFEFWDNYSYRLRCPNI